jgi:phosphohistidine phosphatase
MKTLLLLRHAKSSWDSAAVRDFDRPLANRGERDAPRIGRELGRRGVQPDLIVSSPAARAKATIELVASSAGFTTGSTFNESIYGASSAELIRFVRKLPGERSCVLIVGHNPGFEDLVNRLTGSNERMPTAALACIEFDRDDWADVDDEKAKLAWLITPKTLVDGKE